ncbi:MAG: toxin-antitoxin system HicB family antitoxin [Spirochaetes bacterium]|nr:toxin-antitoxin system HicB family antitoxin [Spirochaetota bacterium]
MNKITEKYTYRIEWSEEDNTHIARCLEFPSLAAHGEKAEDALLEIEKVVEETIKWIEEEHEPIPEPLGLKKYKGNLTLRVPPDIHRELAIKSAEEGVSINQFILSKL